MGSVAWFDLQGQNPGSAFLFVHLTLGLVTRGRRQPRRLATLIRPSGEMGEVEGVWTSTRCWRSEGLRRTGMPGVEGAV